MSTDSWSDSQRYFWSLFEMYDYARLYDVFTTFFKVFQVITRKNPESVLSAEKLIFIEHKIPWLTIENYRRKDGAAVWNFQEV